MSEMEKSAKRLSGDSSKRSYKAKRTSRDSKELKESRVSVIKEESVDADQNTDFKESITSLFFDSFFTTLIVEKKSLKLEDIISVDSSETILHFSSNESADISYTSMSMSETSRGTSSYMKDAGSQRISNISSSSDGTSTIPSCASSCACCWKVAFSNGDTYEGHLNDLLMEGKGTYHWTDGSIYKGEFKDGYPCGQGKLTLPDLSTYEGAFNMGFFHGNGTFSLTGSPILYKGDWKLSQKNGKGWLLYEPNNWYEGDWMNNQKHGYGYRHYKNGDVYKGSWLNDKISGQGYMVWHNNDYYCGEWSNGLQEGYGEYTWNIINHNYFVFPNYNSYKGHWICGERSGAGIMNFGHESGATLAGTWLGNKKHGPGSMICGNGMILERNPLFTDDKPATFNKEDNQFSIKKESSMNTFNSICKHIASREKLQTLKTESVLNITQSGSNIKLKQYLKLLDRDCENPPPLKIPIHPVIHEVDLEYFVENFMQPGFPSNVLNDISTLEIEHMINAQIGITSASPSCVNYLPSNADFGFSNLGTTASQHCVPNTNELKNLIINFLPQLRNVYKTYALLCVEDESICFEPVLIRLFLWQLYRDIGVTDARGISIVDVDEMLMKNPSSCLNTAHSPWEPIYFWQFLQAMVGVACLMFKTENHLDYTPSSGFMYHMFKDFIERKLLVLAGIFQGNSLTKLRDLIPIEAIYKIYREIGEPHTVEEFLKNTCLKKGEHVPCYKILDCEDGWEVTVEKGSNVVVLNHELSFSETSQKKYKLNNLKPYEGLYTFSCLGRKKILKSLRKICPQLVGTSGRYQLQYRLSFIEFHEVMLLLAFEKVEQERLERVEELKVRSMSEMKCINAREASKMSTHSAKKLKKGKK